LAAGTLGEAMRVMHGQLLAGDSQAPWSGAAIDSRQVGGGELFFALAGEQTDGHHFVGDALSRGASAAVVQRPVERPPSGGLIRIADVQSGLHALTRHVRRRVPEHLVAVTGSVGKTTTKELLAAMLERRFRVARSPGNLNNLLGFPLSLLSVQEATQWMVAEMGMSTPGELSQLSRLSRPDAVVFTNVRAVHLENFGSVREIADAKGELLDGISANGLVIANADDPEVMRLATRHTGRVVSFGISRNADHRARDIVAHPQGGSRFVWSWSEGSRTVRLPLLGAHNVANFLAAAACASALGVDHEEIEAVAAKAVAAPGRGQLHEVAGAVIIDDSYNSNPTALEAALESARALQGDRHWAVLGDMLELGEESRSFHRRLGAAAAQHGFSPIIAVGEAARDLADAAREHGVEVVWFASAAAASTALPSHPRAGDVILVKGSRGVGLEVVVRRLLAAGRSA